MSEDEKLLLRDAVNSMRLLSEKIEAHAVKLDEGSQKMQSLEISLAKLKCGEHAQRMDTIEKSIADVEKDVEKKADDKEVSKHIMDGKTWRLAILCSCIGLLVSVFAGVGMFYTMQEKVSHIERTIYAEHKNN